MTPEEKKKVNRRVVFFAGKAAPACESNPGIVATPMLTSTRLDYIAKLV